MYVCVCVCVYACMFTFMYTSIDVIRTISACCIHIYIRDSIDTCMQTYYFSFLTYIKYAHHFYSIHILYLQHIMRTYYVYIYRIY